MGAENRLLQAGLLLPGGVLELRQGQWWFGSRAEGVRRLGTLLGSCVAVTLWHQEARLGGMCHFLVPRRGRPVIVLDGRFGDEAIELLEGALRLAGTPADEYEVGIFGGANMFPLDPKVTLDIGADNVRLVRGLLEDHGLRPRRMEVMEYAHRQLLLDLVNGDIELLKGKAVLTP